MTIWQRLNMALAVLILLLMAGVCLALWVERTGSSAVHRSDELDLRRNLIQFDLILMSDALRGMLVDPTDEVENKRRDDAVRDLTGNLDFIRTAYAEEPELFRAVKSLRDFSTGTLIPFHNGILETLKTDPAAATAEYNN